MPDIAAQLNQIGNQISTQVSELIAAFSKLPTDEKASWTVIALGSILVIIALFMLIL